MEITDVRVKLEKRDNGKMKGSANIVIDNAVAIRDIRILEGENGMFIARPSRKTPTGKYVDQEHPINKEVRKQFEDAIFAAYEKSLEEGENAEEVEE